MTTTMTRPVSVRAVADQPERSVQVKIPKLTYRNAQPSTLPGDNESISPSSSAIVSPTRSIPEISSSVAPSPAAEEFPGSVTTSPHKRSISSPSSSPPQGSPSKQTSVRKKSPSLFSGLFRTREPSTTAFAQMEEQLKRQSAEGGRINPAGMPGVSSAKLPAKVPKVNSKWDGLPTALKEKQQQGKENPERRKSTCSVGPSQSTDRDSRKSRDRRTSSSTVSSLESRGGGRSRCHTQHSSHSSSSGRNSVVDFAVEASQKRSNVSETASSVQTAHTTNGANLNASAAKGSGDQYSSPSLPVIIDETTSTQDQGKTGKERNAAERKDVDGEDLEVGRDSDPAKGLAIQMQRSNMSEGPFLAGETQPFRVTDDEDDESRGSHSSKTFIEAETKDGNVDSQCLSTSTMSSNDVEPRSSTNKNPWSPRASFSRKNEILKSWEWPEAGNKPSRHDKSSSLRKKSFGYLRGSKAGERLLARG